MTMYDVKKSDGEKKSIFLSAVQTYRGSLSTSLPFGGVAVGKGSDWEYGSDPHTILESAARPWSRIGRVRWSNESELELELSPGSLRTICFGGILPEKDKRYFQAGSLTDLPAFQK